MKKPLKTMPSGIENKRKRFRACLMQGMAEGKNETE